MYCCVVAAPRGSSTPPRCPGGVALSVLTRMMTHRLSSPRCRAPHPSVAGTPVSPPSPPPRTRLQHQGQVSRSGPPCWRNSSGAWQTAVRTRRVTSERHISTECASYIIWLMCYVSPFNISWPEISIFSHKLSFWYTCSCFVYGRIIYSSLY